METSQSGSQADSGSASPIEARTSHSVCDVCLIDVPSEIRQEDETVFLVKFCPEHGERKVPMSDNGVDYLRLDQAFHQLFPKNEAPQPTVGSSYFITNACNLGCDYCLNEANSYAYFDNYPVEGFEERLRQHDSPKVDLLGGEPFSHPRFFDFVAAVAHAGKTLVAYTNGLAFADEKVVERLKKEASSGLEVRMTFEGFEAEDYEHFPVGRVRERKLKALENLKKHNVSTVLGHTILTQESSTYGDRQLHQLIDYAQNNRFVRGLTFQGIAALGGSRNVNPKEILSVDQVMDRVVGALDQAERPFNRREVYLVQKLVYLMARIFALPICAYVQAAILFRVGKRWVGLDYLLDSEALDRRLNQNLGKNSRKGRFRLALSLFWDLLATVRLRRLPRLVRLGFETLPVFSNQLDFAAIPPTLMPLVSITVCDRYNYDESVGRRCEKNVQSLVRGQVVTELCSNMAIRQLREREHGIPHQEKLAQLKEIGAKKREEEKAKAG